MVHLPDSVVRDVMVGDDETYNDDDDDGGGGGGGGGGGDGLRRHESNTRLTIAADERSGAASASRAHADEGVGKASACARV
jgi:hypothetical protein